MPWFRLVLVAAYLLMLVHHGREGSRHTRTLSDYLVAGRNLGGVVIAFSFYATFVSTNSFIGQAGESWEAGLAWWLKVGIYGPLCWLSWLVVAPRFYRKARDFGSLTVADFLGARYNSQVVRRLTAVVILLASGLYLVAIYKGSSVALSKFLDLDYSISAAIVFVVVTTYTLLGGFRSVVLTDSVQGMLMTAGALLMLYAVVHAGGGISPMIDELEAIDPQLVSWDGPTPLMVIIGIGLAGGLKLLVDPRQVSRIYGLKDERALRTARILSPILITVTYFCLLPIGALSRTIVPTDVAATITADTDQLTPYLLGEAEILGSAASSVFLLVLLAAAMSSLDSVLLVTASAITRDLQMLTDDHPRAILHTRCWVVAVSLLAMLVALNPFADIVEITAFSGSLYAACFLSTLVLGLYWSRPTATAALGAMSSGAVVVVAWWLAKRSGWTDVHEVYVGLAVSTLVFVILTLSHGSKSHTETGRLAS